MSSPILTSSLRPPPPPPTLSPSHPFPDLSADITSIDPLPRAQGSFSDLHKGMLAHGIPVAIKIFRVCNDDDANIPILEHYRREVQAHELLGHNHQHFVKFLGVATIGRRPAIIMKWYENGNTTQYLHLNPHASARRYALDIVKGIKSLHTHNSPITHGDLKATNIVVDDDGNILLADLGSARIVNDTAVTAANVGGSCRFMAPEMFPTIVDDDTQSPQPTLASDIWSLGCTIAEIITFKKPYHTRRSHSQVVCSIANGILPYTEVNFTNDCIREGIAEYKDIWQVLEKCWVMDPALRPTIVEFEGLVENLFGAY
ncbi:hypothetical protein JAAARDRAFT_190572 [Jaapia argillacea MUCL 33604]|uniref:Protein kinase domain-containing protein n=1 Tax=Jaapia argillacea MUCL 33604 TaxID=933084 RepID=A0A067Q460_9AGAM|nr:hypothetical protein JAAARDRAFT_190572 [Jaapia argillacea MUCL 33604]